MSSATWVPTGSPFQPAMLRPRLPHGGRMRAKRILTSEHGPNHGGRRGILEEMTMSNRLDPARPTVPDVIERFRAYHALPDNGAWGSLHIVLDDGNVDDDSVRFCIDWANKYHDTEGEELAHILLQMSKTQRLRLSRGA